MDVFSATNIDFKGHAPKTGKEDEEWPNRSLDFLNQIRGHDIVQLRSNFIPRGLVPLKQIFDHNDVSTQPIFQLVLKNIKEHNSGIE